MHRWQLKRSPPLPNTAKTRKRSTQTSAPRKRTRSPEPDLSGKERIFQAAQIHFQSHSYASTRVDDICRAAGMSKGAFYLHFRTKEEMMEELFREFFLRIKNEIDEFLRITPPSPLAALELFRKSLEVSQAQLHMTRLFFESMGAEISGPDHGLNRWVSSVFDDFAKNLQKWLKLPDSARPRIRALISCMDGIVLHWAFFDTPPSQRKKQIDAFLEMVDHSTSGGLPG